MIQLAVVIPCYNEEEVLPETASRLTALFDRLIEQGRISHSSHIYFVNDGSQDNTWEIIENLAVRQPYIVGIKLARNVGHQRALLAGLLTAEGNAVISLDADLQDDIDAITEMLDEFNQGSEIVYGVRVSRDTDTLFKCITARGFYKFMRLMGVDLVEDHADYRLMGRRAIEALREFGEVNLFLRGMVPLIGFTSTTVYYDRATRFAGASKYPLRRMLAFALDGITSFSVIPLRMVSAIGSAILLFSVLLSIWVLTTVLFTDRAVPGWASTVLPLYFIGGVQIFCIGILGEYAGRIYQEVKHRPRFVIEKMIRSNKEVLSLREMRATKMMLSD